MGIENIHLLKEGDTSDPMELIIGPIPMYLNLSDFGNPRAVIGHARGYRKSDGTTHIAIHLDVEASKQLINLNEVFQLKGLGFAGIKREP